MLLLLMWAEDVAVFGCTFNIYPLLYFRSFGVYASLFCAYMCHPCLISSLALFPLGLFKSSFLGTDQSVLAVQHNRCQFPPHQQAQGPQSALCLSMFR